MKRTLTFFSLLFILFLILQRGSGIIAKILLANAITPEEYAIITLVAISLPALLQMVTTLNLYQILSHSQEGRQYFSFSVIVSMAIFFIISVFLLLFSSDVYSYLNLSTDQANLFSFAILFTLGSLTLLTDLQGLFAGMKDYSITGLILALPSFARMGIIAFLALAHIATLQTAILAYALSLIIPFIIFMLIPRYRTIIGEATHFRLPSWKMMAFGTSLVIVTSVPILGQSLAKVAISHKIGVLWQGYFDVSLTLTSLLIFSISTLGLISLPESTTGDIESIGKKGGLVDVSRLLLAFTVLAGIILSIYSRDIVVFLFSSDFVIAAKYVPILVIAYIFLFFQLFLVNINMATASTKKHFLVPTIISIVILPFFLTSAEWLIDIFSSAGMENGLVGAYISYTVLVIILTITIVLFTHDRSPLRYLFLGIWRLLIPSLAVTGLLLWLQPGPVVGILLACGLFTFLLFYLKYVDVGLLLEILHDPKSQE